ncbi:hypothetical protein CRE_25921 [Caenorhabditis remanei]|uniref:Ubiquitin-like domain-containing protein n=1 Tax=Caenorhabditis remanei TaxID=31234 RepID=E3NI45_CAERE|nr:hypothetical protein CRE_25921 [Caenorhabditis remanei]
MSEPQEQQQQEQSLSATQESSDQPPATTAPAPPATQTSPPHRMPQLSAQTIQVTVKTLDDREATVTIALDQTVHTLISRARAQLNVSSGSQRIIFGGRVLHSAQTVQGAGITNGQTVHLVDRGPSAVNDRPNVTSATRGIHAHAAIAQPVIFPRPIATAASPDSTMAQSNFAVIPNVRVPASIGGSPVLSSKIAEEVITQKSISLRLREIPVPRILQPASSSQFLHDPTYIQWTIKVVDDLIFRPRERIEQIVRQTINELPFLPATVKSGMTLKWEQRSSVLTLHFPEISPHVPSPALEKLDFLALWTENLEAFVAKLIEADGLTDAVNKVLLMAQSNERVERDVSQAVRDARVRALDNIAKDLEDMWAGVTHQRDFERVRFQNNNSLEYRHMKIEEYSETARNPRYFMRHALDTDLLKVIRKFRVQSMKFAALEDIVDELNECGALKFIRDSMTESIDYRYRALSMFFHYMQRMRHQVAHMTHLVSDLDVPFMTPNSPQRLLPNYASNVLTVPFPHSGTIKLLFSPITDRNRDQFFECPIVEIIEPPRVLSDVAGRHNGDWPYLPYHPPSVHMESVHQTPRRMADPRLIRMPQMTTQVTIPHMPMPGTAGVGQAQHFVVAHEVNQPINILGAVDQTNGLTIADVLQQQQEYIEQFMAMGAPEVQRRTANRPRRVVTTGDAPSIPVETQPPPGDAAQPGPSTRRTTTGRFNVQPEARGAETETLAAFPVQIEPSELQRIARNIASRYRAEALQRIATSLTARFNDESWDTRLQNMPLCTLRECVAIALELLTSSGNSVNESRDLMLALVRDEEVLVRAIAECVKSLFGRGEFPTHVARIIMPRSETAGSRNDYESVDYVEDAQSDEYDGMIVRVPSDISQPQSGDLRAIRERRQSRRQLLENRRGLAAALSAMNASPSASTLGPSNPPPGPSFNSEDAAEIRAGRLPLGNRPNRRTVRETVHPTPARAESPNHISVTFTSHTFPAFAPLVMGAGPSTSQGPSWPEAPNLPIRPVVSPTPTTGGLLDFDISEGSDQPEMVDQAEQTDPQPGSSSTPSPPSTTSGATSAPATVTSSPSRHYDNVRRASPDMVFVDGEPVLETQPADAVRAARAQIDHLAANFNGNLADTRRQNPFTATEDFMISITRHEERRPVQVGRDDPDYNYTIKRDHVGELRFDNMSQFKNFMKTMVRSLMAHCIDADSVHTMNMHPISGYPAANHAEIIKMVRTHLSTDLERTGPYSRPNGVGLAPENLRVVDRLMRERERNMQQFAQRMANPMLLNENILDRPLPPISNTFPAFPTGIDLEREVLVPGRIASMLTYLVDYMEIPENPRPPGLFGFLLDITFGILTRHDFAQMARESTASNVLLEYARNVQMYINDKYLAGKDSNSMSAELHEIAETIVNNETFFTKFLDQNPQLPKTLDIGNGSSVDVVWIFRQIELSFIKSLLTMSLCSKDSRSVSQSVMKVGNEYLYRNMTVFFRLSDRNLDRLNTQLKRVSDYFATIRYGETAEAAEGINEFIGGWNCVMERYFNSYKNFSERHLLQFIQKVRTGGADFNDVAYMMDSEPSSSSSYTSQPSSSSGQPATATTVSTNNRRKRNHAGRAECDNVDVDMVAPMMTSLSTSSPLMTSTGTSTGPGVFGEQGPSESTDNNDDEME